MRFMNKAGRARRAGRHVEQRVAQRALRVPQREATRQSQRQSRLPPCPERDGATGPQWPRTMDQKPRPASAASGAGEPQGARRVGRQGGGPAPTALRAADFGVARA